VPDLWLYLFISLRERSNVAVINGLIDRAAAAGYSSVVLGTWDLELLGSGVLPSTHEADLRTVLDHAASKGVAVIPQVFDFGHSKGITLLDPDLAEGQKVVGATFTVASDGHSLLFNPGASTVANPGFETRSGNRFSGWATQEGTGTRTFADTAVHHSGAVSMRIAAGSGPARVGQTITLNARRQYHLSFWLKTSGFSGTIRARLTDAATGHPRNFDELSVKSTQDWTRYDTVVNSTTNSSLVLTVGAAGTTKGTAWIDDVALREVALFNVLRRSGTPLAVYDATTKAVFKEGTDYAPIADPLATSDGVFSQFHTPPTVQLPSGTHMLPGEKIKIDFYGVSTINQQTGACLTVPAIFSHLETLTAALDRIFPAGTTFLLNYDEIRHENTCGSCAALGLSAAGLLDNHLARAVSILRAKRPTARLLIWSDMFDPNHNAVALYYLANGSFVGSWTGLPSGIEILNWNLNKLATSLSFFSQLGRQQMIAGFYDRGDAATQARAEIAAAHGIAGVRGLMYTSFDSDYSQLEAFATAARAAWPP
jgi:hypothetical protein